MEMLLRNLAGIQLAEEHSTPGLLEQMEWAAPEAVVPDDILRDLIKDHQRRAKLKPSRRPPSGTGKDTGAGGGKK